MADHRRAVLLSCVLAAALAGSACAQSSAQSCGGVGLCIVAVTSSVTQDREIVVHAQIANNARTSMEGAVWWVLAPIGPGSTLDRAVFQSRIEKKIYASNTSASLNWATIAGLPSGFYDLVLFAYRVRPDGSETVADESALEPVYIAAPKVLPWLIRRREGLGPLVVISASGSQASASEANLLSRTVVLRNRAVTVQHFSLRLEARTLLAGWENRWFTTQTLYSTNAVTGSVGGHADMAAEIDGSAPAALRVFFPTAQFWAVVSVAGTVNDEVLLGGPETFQGIASMRLSRLEAPSGPVEIAGIDDHGPWASTGLHLVTLKLINLSGTQQVVQAWWFLGAMDDPQPWAHGVVGGFSAQLTLGPWATIYVPIRAYHSAIACQCKLSAWAHYWEGTGGFVPTDDLWLAPIVSIS
jgi:hypothetical protein